MIWMTFMDMGTHMEVGLRQVLLTAMAIVMEIEKKVFKTGDLFL